VSTYNVDEVSTSDGKGLATGKRDELALLVSPNRLVAYQNVLLVAAEHELVVTAGSPDLLVLGPRDQASPLQANRVRTSRVARIKKNSLQPTPSTRPAASSGPAPYARTWLDESKT
jgi:hypothetical protein